MLTLLFPLLLAGAVPQAPAKDAAVIEARGSVLQALKRLP